MYVRGKAYDKVDALYAGLKELCSALRERADNGEDVNALALETWDFFCTIH